MALSLDLTQHETRTSLAARAVSRVDEKPSLIGMDRADMASALLPSIQSNIGMRELVGGDSNVLGFYDGDHRDVYTHRLGCITCCVSLTTVRRASASSVQSTVMAVKRLWI